MRKMNVQIVWRNSITINSNANSPFMIYIESILHKHIKKVTKVVNYLRLSLTEANFALDAETGLMSMSTTEKEEIFRLF